MTMAISIALATYNGEAFLAQQLESLAAQTSRPAELVVGDDGSTDSTLEILAEFAARAPFPVHITRNAQRLGYRDNFIALASRCRSPLIAFCDQDDVWQPEKLARMAGYFDDPCCLLAYHNALVTDQAGTPHNVFYTTPPQDPVAAPMSLPPWHFAHGFAQVFRRDLLLALPFRPGMPDTYAPGETMAHDLFFFTIAATLGRIAYCHDSLVRYRQHTGQVIGMTSLHTGNWLADWRARLEDRREIYRHLSRVAAANAGLFASLSGESGLALPFRDRAVQGAEIWSLLAGLYADRAQACAAASTFARVTAWRRLVRAGAYGTTGQWTFGRKAQIKDAVLGVLLAPAVARWGFPGGVDVTCRRVTSPAMA